MLVSSAWLTVWHSRFCVALCCTGLHRSLRGEILANLTIKAQRVDNKLPGGGGPGPATSRRFPRFWLHHVALGCVGWDRRQKTIVCPTRRPDYHERSAVLADELAVRVCFQEDPDRPELVIAAREHSGGVTRIYT